MDVLKDGSLRWVPQWRVYSEWGTLGRAVGRLCHWLELPSHDRTGFQRLQEGCPQEKLEPVMLPNSPKLTTITGRYG